MRPRVLYQTAVDSTSGKDPSPSYTQAGKENDLVNAPSGIDYSCNGTANSPFYNFVRLDKDTGIRIAQVQESGHISVKENIWDQQD
jgi:hypothetical protein